MPSLYSFKGKWGEKGFLQNTIGTIVLTSISPFVCLFFYFTLSDIFIIVFLNFQPIGAILNQISPYDSVNNQYSFEQQL